MGLLTTISRRLRGIKSESAQTGQKTHNTETGTRSQISPSDAIYQQLVAVDYSRLQTVRDIRTMDKADPRVKKIHTRMSHTTVKGGLGLRKTTNKRIIREWNRFNVRLQLNNPQKLTSDARGLIMEGNLPLQWVADSDHQIVKGVRMPSETIRPETDINGQFSNQQAAYSQLDSSTGKVLASFAEWQLTLARLTPDNFDDMGSMGRPYLDAGRETWRQLRMTERDQVLRRHMRAPMRMSHVLEGADEGDINAYKKRNQAEQGEVTANYYSNKKGTVTAVQGDSNLDQIADVVHLLDTFFTGAPGPRGLFGYADGLQRDVLEDLKRDYYEEIDAMQETLASAYQQGFLLHLLLAGINPDIDDIKVEFVERRTETANQATDRALKVQAAGASRRTVWETALLDPEEELKRREHEASSNDPYPEPDNIGPKVSVTPGNQRKGDSATSITNK